VTRIFFKPKKKGGGGSTEESEFEQKTAFSCLAELYSFKIKTASIENVNQHLQGQASESPGIYIPDNIALQLRPDSGRKKRKKNSCLPHELQARFLISHLHCLQKILLLKYADFYHISHKEDRLPVKDLITDKCYP